MEFLRKSVITLDGTVPVPPPWRRHPLLRLISLDNRRDSVTAPGAWTAGAVEGTILCLLALAFSTWASPSDPFGVHRQFPWLWTAPVIVAMRYGTSTGVWTALVLLCMWFTLHVLAPHIGLDMSFQSDVFPQSYFVGGVVWILVCGQFSDVWSGNRRRIMAANAYLNERLQAITRNHFLLRLSHEHLERDRLSKPMTLRQLLVHLRELTGIDRTCGDLMPGAAEFLKIIGQSCQLEIASVHAMTDGLPALLPAASLGAAGQLQGDDPLVIACIQQHKLAHVKNINEATQASRYLVCAPLRAASGKLFGILAVETMPFFALNDDILQLMTVLSGYYADGLEKEHVVSGILKRLPNCPHAFALDLIRLCRIYNDAGIDSSMVALVFNHTGAGLDLFENVKRMKRSIDQCWAFSTDRHHILITLLPLSGEQAVEGYLLRIEHTLQNLFEKDFLMAHLATHVGHLGSPPPAETLGRLLEKCDG